MTDYKETDPELLRVALMEFQRRLATIDHRIAELRLKLAGRGEQGRRPAASEETRERMAITQQRRRAGEPSVKAGKQSHLSHEGKARIAEATRKRWAVYRAAKAAQSE